jgi:hypothetical protein
MHASMPLLRSCALDEPWLYYEGSHILQVTPFLDPKFADKIVIVSDLELADATVPHHPEYGTTRMARKLPLLKAPRPHKRELCGAWSYRSQDNECEHMLRHA